jgi:hypothetical protein
MHMDRTDIPHRRDWPPPTPTISSTFSTVLLIPLRGRPACSWFLNSMRAHWHVEATRQNLRNVKERDRILREQVGRVVATSSERAPPPNGGARFRDF